MPADISLMLYKAYISPHFEYCTPFLLRTNKNLNNKLESANYYASKALLNYANSLDYDSILSTLNMQSLEHRRYYQSLILRLKCPKENGPVYISNLLELRQLHYNLRNIEHNLAQSCYTNRYNQNSFTYKASFME